MTVRFYSSTASEKNLVGTITSGQTTCVVSDTIGLPTSFPYTLALDYETLTEELVQVSSAAGTTLTIVRAIDGTSAVSHPAGARVRHTSSARDFADSRNHENSSDGVHGLGAGEEIVGTDSSQTLSNKTLLDATGTFVNIEIKETGSNDLTVTRDPAGSDTDRLIEWFNGTDRTGEIQNGGHLKVINTPGMDTTTTSRRISLTMSNGTTERFFVGSGGMVTSLPRSATADSNGGFKVIDAGDSTSRKLIQARNSLDTLDKFVVYAAGAVDINCVDPTFSPLDVKAAPSQTANMFRVLDSADNPMIWVDNDGELNCQRKVDIFNDNQPANTVLAVQGHAAQTGTLQSWRLNSGTTVARVRADGSADFTPQNASSGIVTAATGWSVAAQIACEKAGIVTLNVTFLRTGANIVALADGNITDTPVGTVSAAYRPNAQFGSGSLVFAGTTGVGTGSVRATANTGDLTLCTWSTGGTLSTGEGLQLTMTWPIDF